MPSFKTDDIVTLYDIDTNRYISTSKDVYASDNVYRNAMSHIIGARHKTAKQIDRQFSLWKIIKNRPSGRYAFENLYDKSYLCSKLNFNPNHYENKFYISKTDVRENCLFDIQMDHTIFNDSAANLPKIQVRPIIQDTARYLQSRESGTLRGRYRSASVRRSPASSASRSPASSASRSPKRSPRPRSPRSPNRQ